MAQILNGTLIQIVEQCKLVMYINTTGAEITTGTQILNGGIGDIVGQTKQIMFIDSTGQSIS